MSFTTIDEIRLLCDEIKYEEGILRDIKYNLIADKLDKNNKYPIYSYIFDYFDCKSPLKSCIPSIDNNINNNDINYSTIIFNEGLIQYEHNKNVLEDQTVELVDNILYKNIEIYFNHADSTCEILQDSLYNLKRLGSNLVNFKKIFKFIVFKIFDKNDGYLEIILHNALFSTDLRLSIAEKIEIYQTSFCDPSIFKDRSLSDILSLLFTNDIL